MSNKKVVVEDGPMLVIGPNLETVREMRATIMEICREVRDPRTAREAIRAIRDACSVKNTMVTGCNFSREPL